MIDLIFFSHARILKICAIVRARNMRCYPSTQSIVHQVDRLSILILLVVDGDRSIIHCQFCISTGLVHSMTYLPLGSVCLTHLGVQRMTVDAHDGGKCSSNMVRYQ